MSCMLKFFFLVATKRLYERVCPSIGRSVRNQFFFGSLEAIYAVCTTLFVLVWFVILSVVPDDCLVNFVSFSLCFCLIVCHSHWRALPCTQQQCSFLFLILMIFDLMSFWAIVSCHVICIVCHAIRSMSLIFGRICIYVLVDCTAFRRLRTKVGCLWAVACFLLSPGDSWRACFRSWLLSSGLVVDWLLSSLLFDISPGQALSSPFVLLMMELICKDC